jgi:hypothetical protein
LLEEFFTDVLNMLGVVYRPASSPHVRVQLIAPTIACLDAETARVRMRHGRIGLADLWKQRGRPLQHSRMPVILDSHSGALFPAEMCWLVAAPPQ